MGKLDGKVAVITGAASGMGRATAIRFAQEGAAIVVADLNSQGGELVVSEIAAAKGRAVFQRTDVISEDDIKAVINRAVTEFGRLDITYNNAGLGGATGRIEDLRSEDWDKTFHILTRAVFLGITESAAIDLGHDRIRVNCICPGGIVTPLTYRGMPGGEEAALKNMARMQPIPRAGKGEDIAAMALFL